MRMEDIAQLMDEFEFQNTARSNLQSVSHSHACNTLVFLQTNPPPPPLEVTRRSKKQQKKQ